MVIVFNGLELIGIGIVILLYIVVSIIILVNNGWVLAFVAFARLTINDY